MTHKFANRWILWGIPALFLLGTGAHFLYEWVGQFFVVGLFVPVNESIFEHMKLGLLPTLFWWAGYFLFAKNKPNSRPWFSAAFFALLTTSFLIPILYYFCTGALGIQSSVINIFIYLIAVLVGQLLGLHLFCHAKGLPTTVAILGLVLLTLLFIVGTTIPPNLPIFQDMKEKSYGIFKVFYSH